MMGNKHKNLLCLVKYLRSLDLNRIVCMNQVNTGIGP